MERPTRREFLAGLSCAVASGLQPSHGAEIQTEWRNRQPEMKYRQLGRTGFMVSEIVMGGNQIAPDNYEHVLLALDMGLNYLDTAPAYGQGRSELGYQKVIKARGRDRFFLTTKISMWDINRNRLYKDIFDSLPEAEQKKLMAEAEQQIKAQHGDVPDYFVNYFPSQRDELLGATLANLLEKTYGHKIDRQKNYKQLIIDSLHESLKRLGTDYVDIMMCPHGASTAYEVENFPEIFEAYEKLRKEGKVRFLGVTSHSDPAGVLRAAVRTGVYSVAMVAYNIVNHRWVDSALEEAKQAGLGVIAMKVARPVHPGRRGDRVAEADPARVALIEKAVPGPWKVPQKAYIWGLRQKNLSAVISEMIHEGHVRENLPLVQVVS